MCKFHKDVAIQVATDSNGIDPVAYSIMMCALSRYWINFYMPDMGHIDGYSAYEMATEETISAFKNSDTLYHMSQNMQGVIDYANQNSPKIRAAVNEVIAEQGLSLEKLNCPSDPLNHQRFAWAIAQHLFEGEPTQGMRMVKSVKNPKHEPMHRAVDAFFQKNGVESILQEMIAGSFAKVIRAAQEQVNPKLLTAYETLPRGLRMAFASCAIHGSGGVLGIHALCYLLPTAGAANLGMMAAPIVSAAIDSGLEWRRGNDFSWWRSGSVAALSLTLAFGIQAVWPHDHLNTTQAKGFNSKSQGQQDIILTTYRKDYEALPEDLRHRVDLQSAKKGITPELYLAVCDGTDTLGREIIEFQRQQKETNKPQTTGILGFWRTMGL